MAKSDLKYSKAMDELEKIVLEIENGDIEVDELAFKIKRASELLQICSAKLKASEEEVEKILKDLQF
ncbi:MAG: exodeoxyribonuclease small subunit [Bacteroidota bacterium]|jgi:exodeoxyribonuclease VII small subunit